MPSLVIWSKFIFKLIMQSTDCNCAYLQSDYVFLIVRYYSNYFGKLVSLLASLTVQEMIIPTNTAQK